MKDDPMPYTINFLEKEGIVKSVSTGKLTFEDYIKQSKEAVELAQKKNTNLLFLDTSNLDASIKATEILSIPDLWESIGTPRTYRLAVLIPKDESLHEDIKFFENVCRNRGWQTKLFDKKEDAIEWLLKNKQAV
jgi:hypothetical protein